MDIPGHILISMGAFLVILTGLFLASIKQIKPSTVAMYERLGKFKGIKESGWIIFIPFIDNVRIKDLKEQMINEFYEKNPNEDNIDLNIKVEIFYQAVNPIKAAYEKRDLPESIKDKGVLCLCNILIEKSLNEALTSNISIRDKLQNPLNKPLSPWRLKGNKININVIKGV